MITASVAVRVLPIPLIPARVKLPASFVVLLVFLCWAPFILDDFRTRQLATAGVWIVAAMGLNILTGYNGQISLGHGALVALGAYVAAMLMDGTTQMSFVDSSPWPFWLAILMAGFVTAFVGFFLGFPALRLSGPYLAIATLALAISFPSVMRKYDQFTGGSEGIRPPPLQAPGALDMLDRIDWLYFVALGGALLMLLLAWAILRGPLGRAFIAVRDSEVAAEAMGVNVARTKVTAFTISAFFAGVSGGMYTQVVGFISPDSITLFRSITLLAAVVIGGLASILGSVIGGTAFIFLPADAPDLVAQIPGLDVGVVEKAPGAIQGLVVILVMLLMPAGAAGAVQRLQRLKPGKILTDLRALPEQIAGRLPGRGGNG